MQQVLEVNVDVPDGWVATRLGPVSQGEHFLNADGEPSEWCSSRPSQHCYVIVEREFQWQWPDFIKSGTWLAHNEDGVWYLYPRQPELESNGWFAFEGEYTYVDEDLLKVFDFQLPPHSSDWRNSLRRKP